MAKTGKRAKKGERESTRLTATLKAFLTMLKDEGKLGSDPVSFLLARELKEWERVNHASFQAVPKVKDGTSEQAGGAEDAV